MCGINYVLLCIMYAGYCIAKHIIVGIFPFNSKSNFVYLTLLSLRKNTTATITITTIIIGTMTPTVLPTMIARFKPVEESDSVGGCGLPGESDTLGHFSAHAIAGVKV